MATICLLFFRNNFPNKSLILSKSRYCRKTGFSQFKVSMESLLLLFFLFLILFNRFFVFAKANFLKDDIEIKQCMLSKQYQFELKFDYLYLGSMYVEIFSDYVKLIISYSLKLCVIVKLCIFSLQI